MEYQEQILPFRKKRKEPSFLSVLYAYRPQRQNKAGLFRTLKIGTATVLVGAVLFGASQMLREGTVGKEKEVLW